MYSASHGETYNCPAEIAEARYGLSVGWRRLAESDKRTSLHIGGRGLSIAYRLRGRAIPSAGFSHFSVPIWGSNGGQDGGVNGLSIMRQDGDHEDHAFVSGIEVEPGDTILISTANGGGWGGQTGTDR